jgi:hypothetical protein
MKHVIKNTAKTLEQYYTKDTETKLVFETLRKNALLDRCKIFIEPSVGTGSFLSYIPKGRDVIAFDIEPKVKLGAHLYVQQGDFLHLAPTSKVLEMVGSKSKNVCMIGNPPFKPSVKFFNTGAKFADLIAMILPVKFSKSFTQSKLNPYFKLVHEEKLKCSFLLSGQDYCLPTVFQVWIKTNTANNKPVKPIPVTYWKSQNKSHLRNTKKVKFTAQDRIILIKRAGTPSIPVAWTNPAEISRKVQINIDQNPKKMLLNYFLYKVHENLPIHEISADINKYFDKYKSHFTSGKGNRFSWNKDEVVCAYENIPPDDCKGR